MSSIEVIEALCRIVEEALALIQDEQQRRSLLQEFEKTMGGDNVQDR